MRGRILGTAGSLFWKKGYHGTSMKDIAEACKCKPANIYNYFKGKDDILYEVIREMTAHPLSLVEPLGDDESANPPELLREFIKRHFGYLVQKNKSLVTISDTGINDLSAPKRQAIIQLRNSYNGVLRKILRRGVESGDFAPMDVDVISNLIPSLIIRSNIWFSPKGRLTADQVGDIIFGMVYRGIRG